jgi:hypothetical protein
MAPRARLMALLLCTVGLPVGWTAAGAGTADAACQTRSWVDVSSASGHGDKSGGTPIRSGPSADCRVVREVGSSSLLYYHCWSFSSAGNLWTHVRIKGTQVSGWVYNPNLDDGGLRSDATSCSLVGPHA